MPILNSINQMQDEMSIWRKDLHKIPEIGLEEYKTSIYIKKKLPAFKVYTKIPPLQKAILRHIHIISIIYATIQRQPAIDTHTQHTLGGYQTLTCTLRHLHIRKNKLPAFKVYTKKPPLQKVILRHIYTISIIYIPPYNTNQ